MLLLTAINTKDIELSEKISILIQPNIEYNEYELNESFDITLTSGS